MKKIILLLLPCFVILTSCSKIFSSAKNVFSNSSHEKKTANRDAAVKSVTVKTIKYNNITVIKNEDVITNPALRIRTKTREFVLGYRAAVTIVTNDSKKIKSNIIKIESNSIVLAKDNTEINYSDIEIIRIMPSRRWLKWITFPSVVTPIWWTCQRKGLYASTFKCKKQIQDFKVINKYKEFGYGKDKCQ